MVGSQTIAENTLSNGVTTLNWILSDQVASTTVTANADGTWSGQILYTAFGEIRSSSGNTPTQYRFTSQLADSYIKLDWYNSRWYDSDLGHFVQPDSIIPGLDNKNVPNDGIAWDRFAYVGFNPITRNDPTGHKPCYDEGGGKCLSSSYDFLSAYGVSVQGENTKQLWESAKAIGYDGAKYSEILNIPPDEAFRKVHGPVTINVSNTPIGGEGNCETVSSSISCHHAPNSQNILHEMGHVFDNNYYDRNNKTHFASDYVPLEWEGKSQGYKCDRDPCMEHSLQQFPTLDHGLHEEFGDMYLNWILDGVEDYKLTNGFDDSDMGNSRRDWMNSHMVGFLNQ